MKSSHSPRFLSRANAGLLALSLAFGTVAAPAVRAQDATPNAASTPAASPAASEGVERNELMSYKFEKFPPAPMTVRMLRIIMEPGASVPMHTHPGPEFDLVEKGSVTVKSTTTVPVTRANGETESVSKDGSELAIGDWVVFEPGAGMYFQNNGSEPVIMLSSVLLPVGSDYPQSITYVDGKPDSSAFAGVSYTVLGDGLIQTMPGGKTNVSISEVTVAPEASLPASDGIAMYSQVDGNFSFKLDAGAVQVSRTTLRSLQPNAVPGEEFTLAAGDAAFFPSGVDETTRPGEKGSLKLLTLNMTFEKDVAEAPADLTFREGTTATPSAAGATPAASASPAASPAAASPIGKTVTTRDEGVNMRVEPTTEAELVEQLPAGTELKVIGGPQKADDYIWYEVELTDDSGQSGWVVSEFLDGLNAPAATPTAASDGTQSATPSASRSETNSTFKQGDNVVTTEEGVRLRPTAGTEEDAIDAFPKGTSLTVTGAPVKADNVTWVPVVATWDETIVGYVPAQYITLVKD